MLYSEKKKKKAPEWGGAAPAGAEEQHRPSAQREGAERAP